MERLNSEGIPREQLALALRTRRVVLTARRVNSCMLCKRIGVNETGLCAVCFSLLDDEEELRLAGRWLIGDAP